MSQKRIAIIHFYPLEFFPPVTNLLVFLSSSFPKLNFLVCSTHNNKNRKIFQLQGAKLKRYALPKIEDNAIVRAFKYALFYISSLVNLILKKPDIVIYYESISSWPVYIYSKYINKKCEVVIHYHEYASLEWYSKYMKLVKYFHKLERSYLYDRAVWISQTNQHRLKMFRDDNPKNKFQKLHVLPNYPPKNWRVSKGLKKESDKIRVVYVGSLSFEGTLIQEFCLWVNSQSHIIFDIYSYNLHSEVRSFLNEFKGGQINFYDGGIDYQEIPKVLKQYDVGVILHKAYNENYKYNATNKLFEYLICDLDVWFPNEMIGCHEFVTKGSWPEVIGLDFNNLDMCKSIINTDRKELVYKPKLYFSEDTFKIMADFLFKNRI